MKWGKCKLFLSYCITGSVNFDLISNMPISVYIYHVFHQKFKKKKTDFYEACGDDKPRAENLFSGLNLWLFSSIIILIFVHNAKVIPSNQEPREVVLYIRWITTNFSVRLRVCARLFFSVSLGYNNTNTRNALYLASAHCAWAPFCLTDFLIKNIILFLIVVFWNIIYE